MNGLKQTPLTDLHKTLGARMVPFAGYEMPVQYPAGVMAEHLHCRGNAGLFDVSHMGQVIVTAPGGYAQAAAALEALIPVDLLDLGEGWQRYGMFTNDQGGILDDLMLARRGEQVFVVVNAACKDADLAHMRAHMPDCTVTRVTDRALLALQGPKAAAVMAGLVPGTGAMRFMNAIMCPSDFGDLWISRSGYTGEDGFEVSVPADRAQALARCLLDRNGVAPAGLGARDSLRLEAGLCLYGHDIDETITPAEAALGWAIQKVRRTGGDRAGGFPGAGRILQDLAQGAPRRRVGLSPEGRAPMREGTALFADAVGGDPVGRVTSGGFGPSLGAPVSMGYVPRALSGADTPLWGEVRGKRQPVRVSSLPFVPAGYKR